MDTTVNGTAVQEISDLVRPVVHITEDIHYAIVPKGMTILTLRDYQYPHGVPPTRIIASPAFADQASFCSYVNTYKDERTRITADPTGLKFTGLIDYHRVGAPGDVKPEFVSHKPGFQLKYSEQWNLWSKLNDTLIPQEKFAEHLEDNRADIAEPAAADLIEIADKLTATTNGTFASKINRKNGTATLNWSETVDAKVGTGEIEMPEMFTLNIPVFFGEAPIKISCRLRFRIQDGSLRFQYKMARPGQIVMEAFDTTRQEIAKTTSLEVLLGNL